MSGNPWTVEWRGKAGLPDHAHIRRQIVGKAIRAGRERAEISQRGLAKVLDIDPTYLSHIEAGRREMSMDLFCRAMQWLDIGVWIFDRRDYCVADRTPHESKEVENDERV